MSSWYEFCDSISDDDEFYLALHAFLDELCIYCGAPPLALRAPIMRMAEAHDDEIAYTITQVRNEYEASDTYHHDVGFDEGYQAAMEERDGA